MSTFVFPGQGSQYKGMGSDIFEGFKDLITTANAVLGYSIKKLCLQNENNLLNQTLYTQPALFVVNVLSYLKRIELTGQAPTYVAGHSLGEYSALFAAGAFDFETGLRLVQRRGELMAQSDGGRMAAVMGANKKTIERILIENELTGIDFAAYNATSQIVISGPQTELEIAVRSFAKMQNVACVPLNVSAAFHSRYMKNVRRKFIAFLDEFHFNELKIPVISNVTAAPYKTDIIKQLLSDQITHAVNWTNSIQYILDRGETDFVEIGPGDVLSGLIEKIKAEQSPIPLKNRVDTQKPDEIDKELFPINNDIKSHQNIEFNAPVVKQSETTSNGTEWRKNRIDTQTSNESGSDIAIIGMACRFPGAHNYNQFWENLENGVNSIREIIPDRWDINTYYSADINEPNKSVSKWCGLVEDIDMFDNRFFNISPREAKNMDPQQRLLLEETWHCIEDSGVPLEGLRSKKTAVYIGVMASDYRQEVSSPDVLTDSYAASGNYDAMLANRISYALGFTGASISIDAACASSLVALNGAKRSLVTGESDYAVAGGVNLNLHPWKYISFSKARMLSPDGQCKTFDTEANGYVPGEGIGVLLLQRLEDALSAGNHVYAVIKGSAVNHGGQTQSLTAPRVKAQQDVILEAYQEAGFNPETVSYVEAHGTGTSLGDPIEVEALTRSFRAYTHAREFCKIGSVKTNIGHLEAAAGVAGIIKVLMMMQHGKIPRTLNIRNVNPIIRFAGSPFTIAEDLSDWIGSGQGLPLRAGVSSFGMGGVNAHVLLEQFSQNPHEKDTNHSQLFVLSAKTKESLVHMLTRWKKWVSSERFSGLKFRDICWTMLTGRKALPYRLGFLAKNKADLKKKILKTSAAAASERSEKQYCLRIGTLEVQSYDQIKVLFENNTIFSEYFDAIQKDLNELSKKCRSFKDIKLFQELKTGFKKTTWTARQKMVYTFMTSYSAVAALTHIGATPGMIAGESQGVLASLAASGIIKPIEALAILTGQKKPGQLELARPKIPFFNPDTGKTIKPYHFSQEYIRFIRDELRVDDGLFHYYIKKAQLLFNSQFTYKRYLQEWNGVLNERSKEIARMLFGDSTEIISQSNLQREKLLLLSIIISSLRKLHLKWDLTQHKPIVDQLFSELIDLVVDGVMTKKVLVELLIDDHPDLPGITRSLCKRHRYMDFQKPYRYIRTQNHHLKEIEDVSEWLDRISTVSAPMPDTDDMVFVNFGKIEHSISLQKTISLQIIGDLDKSFKLFLLKLWLQGVHIEWGKIFKQGAFTKIALPGYVFNRKSFWLHPKAGCKRAAPESGETEKLNNPDINPSEIETHCNCYHDHSGAGAMNPELNISDQSFFLSRFWEKSHILPKNQFLGSNNETTGNILIFGTDERIRKTLISKTAHTGEKPCIILVKPEENYQCHDKYTYGINPGRQEDYQLLVETLKNRNIAPKKIIHMWSYTDFQRYETELNAQLTIGVYTLFYLTRELIRQHIEGRISLLYIYATHEDNLQPQCAAVEGFAKTIRLENPRLLFKTFEIGSSNTPQAEIDPSHLCDIFLHELQLEHMDEVVVRYKGAQRWVKRFMELDLANHKTNTSPLKHGGVYLITGGAGGLGLLFAEHLAKAVEANIVLSGRSELTPEKSALLNKLTDSGSQVFYIQSDIAKRNDVNDLIAKIKSRFKGINGVIHAAGLVRDAFLIHKRSKEVNSVLAPKIFGAVHLDKALISENLDFFMLFSSAVALTGNLGQCDYAYANSFLDNFAHWRERLRTNKKRSGKTISINWPLWQEGGMQISAGEQNLFSKATGSKPLPTKEGIECFNIALQSGISQCIVGFGRMTETKHDSVPSKLKRRTIKMLNNNKIDQQQIITKTEQYLKSVIAELIEISVDELDSRVAFKEYGIDSIMIHHFNASVGRYFNSLSKTLLFEYQNIKELTSYMIRNHGTELVHLFGMPVTDLPSLDQEPAKPQMIGANLSDFTQTTATVSCSHENQPLQPERENEIAIIGLSGSYPDAGTLDEFWDNLKSGKNCVTEIPDNRWKADRYFDPRPENAGKGKLYCKWGAFLKDVDMFDPLFFNIAPQEAELMDPQERLFLETAWKTFEDAGYTSQQIEKFVKKADSADVGVFVGVTTNSYPLLGPQNWHTGYMPIPTSFPWSIANRVSYIFNFSGPSMPVDTACASSLTAVHMACQSILNGECQMALAGGVNLYLHPAKYVWLCQMRMLSPNGRCSSFGDGADGFVPGEGVGAVLLKPLTAAVRDKDNIYAIIKGTAINHGGLMHGYTVPNPNAQAELVSQALKKAHVDPRSISYIEAHGTGTELGDPVEITGLNKAFRKHSDDCQYCSIGSLKSNIGHLEAAAGIAGLTKVILQLKYRQLVPSLHSNILNQNIDFKNSPFYVQQTFTPWKKQTITANGGELELPRRAGVSSFGAGGTNVHVIIEEYKSTPAEENDPLPVKSMPQLIVLSAKSEARLKLYVQNLLDFLKKNDDQKNLANIAYTFQVGRKAMEARLAIVTDSMDKLRRQLKDYIADPEGFERSNQVFTNKNKGAIKTIIHNFTKGMFGKDFIDLVVTHRDLNKIALLWVSGTDIPWDRIHEGQKVRKISLPTYPFDRKRYWVSGPIDHVEKPVLENSDKANIGTEIELNPERPVSKDRSNVHHILKKWISEQLKVPDEKIEADCNLREYGFSSLNAMRLIHRIEDKYDIKMKPAHIFNHNTVNSLAGFLLQKLGAIVPDFKHKNVNICNITSESETVSFSTITDVDKLPISQVDDLLTEILESKLDHCIRNQGDRSNDKRPSQLTA